ncbi:MAG: HAMP domain-containing protein [Clostridia bacterium]|nr:HAMP domain-containing protein [Clostridia bacterium]
MVGDFLFDERVRSQRTELERLSVTAAPLLARADTEALADLLEGAAGEVSGRFLVLDETGKTHLDTEGELTGTLFQSEETDAIVRRGQSVYFGVHDGATGELVNTHSLIFTLRPSGAWYSYCAARLVDGDEVIGVLLLMSPVTDMMTGLFSLQRQMLLIFLLVALIAFVVSLLFSSILTRPIQDMTRAIQRMAKGNFSERVKVSGTGEIRRLAETFNTMSEKIETLDLTRNQFVANASHELKTPLAAMKVMIESLIYQPDMDKALRTEFLQDTNKEIDRLSAIVSDLLTLVRMDANSVQLTREPLTIAELVQENAHRLDSVMRKRDQTLELKLEDPCDLNADRGKLNQVIYNLMENASKYTQEGGEITVTLARVGRDAVLTVADNGPGIPKDSIPHIFDRFYRVDKARSRETGGTGLGLSIVKQLVLLHGGTIRVESEEGVGSSFIVELPFSPS